ncbi:MAG: MFS transporter [Nostoc sp. DedQUE12b]|uniref:MFS transporter n=1 Tax=Nostoc sp. DedQUE12b TaxID=3075398 RepID=UPI002AD53E1D|nr:MFS transporter [Nostoc sp. DedQUE12b]MDZ8087072.1 MFS transporter [Nostoc sp. DedQUE12b]
MRIFTLIWFGQLVSLIGSGLTRFALGVWVYRNTGSVTQFALISLFAILPSILLSPLVGVLVDRWNRRTCIILSDAGAGVSTLAIVLLLLVGRLEVWHIYLVVAVSSIFSAFQWPAYAAATTMLVPKQHLGRANGMVQFAEATSRLLSPMLAGALVVTIQIQGVILIDCVTFLFSVVTLLLVRFPEPKTTAENEVRKSWQLREFTYGWTYITARPGLLGLLIFFAAINFLIGVVSVLVTPLVLAFATANVLGTVLSIGGSGMLVGGLVMSVWGGPKNRILGVFGFTLSGALSIILAGLKPSVPVFFAAAFIYYFGVSMINGCDQAIWQSKVAPAVQGRVFAVRSMLALASLPLAYLIAGPLADGVFEPLLAPTGLLAGSIGKLIGVGRGYGIALLFIVVGILTIIAIAFGYLYQPLRRLNHQLPDAIADEALL